MYNLLRKHQLQCLDLEMPHVQINLHLPIFIHKVAMSFIPRHRFFEDIHPFSRSDFETRSDRQLFSFSFAQSVSEMTASMDNEERGWLDSHSNSSLCSTAE
jgi:hypothetical protein